MSRIEIPLDEYNGLKTKIKNLENSISSISKEASFYKEKYFDLESATNDLKNESLISRMFRWKSIIAPFNQIFSSKIKS